MIKLGLTGWPLEKTLSPAIHREFLRAAGIKGSYLLYPVESGGLPGMLERLHGEGVTGLNITYPHKTAAAGLCAGLDPQASAAEAVNTLTSVGTGWKGFNTDIAGFATALSETGATDPVYVVGAGGAARAAAVVLTQEGRNFLVFCRSPQKWSGEGKAIGLNGLQAHLEGSKGTLVNATVLGWRDDDLFPVSPDTLRNIFFMDLNYNPCWRWRIRLEGVAAGVMTGEYMLVRQAAESFRIWTGAVPDERTVRAVTEKIVLREGDR